jgi:methylmalonyl-CoA/ethylmalonyl-CoA epimerase
MAPLFMDHVGIAVRSIQDGSVSFCGALGIDRPGETYELREQGVRVAFSRLSGEAAVEFVEPIDRDSAGPVGNLTTRGGGLYHVAFRVPDLDAAVARASAQGAVVVTEPCSVSSFQGRRIAFVYLQVGGLLELVEA